MKTVKISIKDKGDECVAAGLKVFSYDATRNHIVIRVTL